MMEDAYTRLRIYNIPDGFLVSYSVDMEFVLIGGCYNKSLITSVCEEMRIAGCDSIDLLHIPSWDNMFCKDEQIVDLLNELQPTEVEIPSYVPCDAVGKTCKKNIMEFCNESYISKLTECSPKYINKSDSVLRGKYLSPTKEYDKPKDNDVVFLYNMGRFSVLSTGMVESRDVVDDIMTKDNIQELAVLLVYRIDQSPFVNSAFIEKYQPLIIIDTTEQKFYTRLDKRLKDYGISTKRTTGGDIIIMSGVRENDNEIPTNGIRDVANVKYNKE